MILSLLGKIIIVLTTIALTAGTNFNDVFIGFRGLDKTNPASTKQEISFLRCDNYEAGPANDENPLQSGLSVRPEKEIAFDLDSSLRGLFHFKTISDDSMIACTKTSVYKLNATVLTTLETGLSDAPWEGILYDDSKVVRMYLVSGGNDNKKYLSGASTLEVMQNKDDQTQIAGAITLTNDSVKATVTASAYATIDVGQYIKSSASADDWVEVISKEAGTTLTFSTRFAGDSGNYNQVIRSNNLEPARHIIEYESYLILGATGTKETVLASSSQANTFYVLEGSFGGAGAKGIAQSFEATADSFNAISLSLFRNISTGGNLILKIKSSLTGEALAQITYPISALPETTVIPPVQNTITKFNFGNVSTTIGNTYWLVIEREDNTASAIYVRKGTAYATGNSAWTYNSQGFVDGWDSGITTIESEVYNRTGKDQNDTWLDKNNQDTNYSEEGKLTIEGGTDAKNGIMRPGQQWPGIKEGIKIVKSDANNFLNVKLQIFPETITPGTSAEVVINRLLIDPDLTETTWRIRDLINLDWNEPGALGLGNDYTQVDSVSMQVLENTLNTFEVTDISAWTTSPGNLAGFLITAESGKALEITSSNADSENRPVYYFTVNTGSSESGEDIFFEITHDEVDASRIIYSVKFDPENYPDLNVLSIPGRIVGFAQSGGYLIVAGKSPDKLHFFIDTDDTADGKGLKKVAEVKDLTFGSSKSIAYLPTRDAFIFYSGLGVYLQEGMTTTLLSGQIREEAKLFQNYLNPDSWYNGEANRMPQSTIRDTKDQYLLGVPNDKSENQYIYVLDYARNVWFRWPNIGCTALTTRRSEGQSPVVYIGSAEGQVFTLNNSGHTTDEAVLEWCLTKGDMTKNKSLSKVEIIGLASNPLKGSIMTLEVETIDETSTSDVITSEVYDSAVDNKILDIVFTPSLSARQIKLKLTQQATMGAIGIINLRQEGSITNP